MIIHIISRPPYIISIHIITISILIQYSYHTHSILIPYRAPYTCRPYQTHTHHIYDTHTIIYTIPIPYPYHTYSVPIHFHTIPLYMPIHVSYTPIHSHTHTYPYPYPHHPYQYPYSLNISYPYHIPYIPVLSGLWYGMYKIGTGWYAYGMVWVCIGMDMYKRAETGLIYPGLLSTELLLFGLFKLYLTCLGTVLSCQS